MSLTDGKGITVTVHVEEEIYYSVPALPYWFIGGKPVEGAMFYTFGIHHLIEMPDGAVYYDPMHFTIDPEEHLP